MRAIPIARSYFDDSELRLTAEVIRSGWIAQGKMVERFEESVRKYLGARHAVAVSSGTAALHMALIIAGVTSEDAVIVPSFSFIATANAVAYCGARPIFIDIEPRTYNIDPLAIDRYIESKCRYNARSKNWTDKASGRVLKAIMPVHQFGLPCDLEVIGWVAAKYGLPIIEDAACALGSAYNELPVGKDSALACFSFHPRKILTTGEGGALVTNNAEYARQARVLRNHGMGMTAMARDARTKLHPEEYRVLGYNYRLTDLQAAVGLGQMSRLAAMLAARKRLAGRYDKAFSAIGGVRVPHIPYYAMPNYQSYILKLDLPHDCSRDAIVQSLLADGIATRRGNTAIHMQAIYRNPPILLPRTEDAARTTIALPLFFGMTSKEQDRVIERLIASIKPRIRRVVKAREGSILRAISLRRVEPSDCYELFLWRNDPVTRRNSVHDTKPVPFEDHKKWFDRRLHDSSSILYMAMAGNERVGLMRFEIGADAIMIGTSVNPRMRGQGIGTKIMGMTLPKVYRKFKKPVLGELRDHNVASLKMCLNNGFVVTRRARGITYIRYAGKHRVP